MKYVLLLAVFLIGCGDPVEEFEKNRYKHLIATGGVTANEQQDLVLEWLARTEEQAIKLGLDITKTNGFKVIIVHPTEQQPDPLGENVAGTCTCAGRTIWVEDKWMNALPHEFFHAYDDCTDHYMWDEKGYTAAIIAAGGYRGF